MKRDALEGEGPQSRPQKRLGRRLQEVTKAVGGGRLLSVASAIEAGTWRQGAPLSWQRGEQLWAADCAAPDAPPPPPGRGTAVPLSRNKTTFPHRYVVGVSKVSQVCRRRNTLPPPPSPSTLVSCRLFIAFPFEHMN